MVPTIAKVDNKGRIPLSAFSKFVNIGKVYYYRLWILKGNTGIRIRFYGKDKKWLRP